MRLTLLHELAQFLTSLEQTQQELLTLFGAKRQALNRFQSEELIRLSGREGQLSARLQELVQERSELLKQARDAGFAVESLQEFAGAIGKTVGDSRVLRAIELIRGRILESQRRTARLQQESWVHWIISHRCYNHFTELIDLIAHGGHRSPVYGDKLATTGGAVLDAAA
jgi:flagellar biosynthesis/type III secretory pathway chaperone